MYIYLNSQNRSTFCQNGKWKQSENCITLQFKYCWNIFTYSQAKPYITNTLDAYGLCTVILINVIMILYTRMSFIHKREEADWGRGYPISTSVCRKFKRSRSNLGHLNKMWLTIYIPIVCFASQK